MRIMYIFFIKSKAENQLKLQLNGMPTLHQRAVRTVHTTVELLRRQTSDFITASNL